MSVIASIACPLCYSLSPTLKLHISHLRLVHQADPNFKLTCAIEDCTKTFFTFQPSTVTFIEVIGDV